MGIEQIERLADAAALAGFATKAWRLAETDLSHDDVRQALSRAVAEQVGNDANGWAPYVRDVFDDSVVYEFEGKLYRAGYTLDEGATEATLGDSVEVRVAYVEVEAPEPADTETAASDDAEEADAGDTPPADEGQVDEAWRRRAFRETLVAGLKGDAGFLREVVTVASAIEFDLDESANLGELVEITEARRDGTIPIKLIQPGWGSSGYYSEDMLARDGAKAFPKGTQMFWDHPTRTEEAERPEGSLTGLAGVLVSDARYQADGPKGPGLYADAKTFAPFAETIDEIAPHIGLSIRALGKASPGQAEGKRGPIIDELATGISVDFVTQAGAGGEVVSVFESARGRPAIIPTGTTVTEKEDQDVEQNERITQLEEQNARIAERLILRDAGDLAASMLKDARLPDVTKARLAESLPTRATKGEDGELDREAFAAIVVEAVKAEAEYLAAAGAGKPSELGDTAAPEITAEEAEAKLDAAMGRLAGVS